MVGKLQAWRFSANQENGTTKLRFTLSTISNPAKSLFSIFDMVDLSEF